MKKLLTLLLATLLFCGPLSGCAGALASIPTVVAIISDATAVLSIIQRALDTWFAIAPPSEEVRQEANQLVADTWAALRIASAAASGADHLSKDDQKKAFAEFQKSYTELHAFLKKHGVLAGSRLAVGQGAEADIPEPLALKL